MSDIPLGDTTWALRKALESVIKRLLAVETTASATAAQPPNLVGIGSPEGVVTAPPGSRYMDISDPAAPHTYEKGSGTGNTGWVG
jgi:hypothetical protein